MVNLSQYKPQTSARLLAQEAPSMNIVDPYQGLSQALGNTANTFSQLRQKEIQKQEAEALEKSRLQEQRDNVFANKLLKQEKQAKELEKIKQKELQKKQKEIQQKLEEQQRFKQAQYNLGLQKKAVEFSLYIKQKDQELKEQVGNDTGDYYNKLEDLVQKERQNFLKDYSQEDQLFLGKALLPDEEQILNNGLKFQIKSQAENTRKNILAIENSLINDSINESAQSVDATVNRYREILINSGLPQNAVNDVANDFEKKAVETHRQAQKTIFDTMAESGNINGMRALIESGELIHFNRSEILNFSQKLEKAAKEQENLKRNDPASYIQNKPYDLTAIKEVVSLQNVDPQRAVVMPKDQRRDYVESLAGTDKLSDFDAILNEIKGQYGEYAPNATVDLIRESKNKKVNKHLMTLMAMPPNIEDTDERRAMFVVAKSGQQEIVNLATNKMIGSGKKISSFNKQFNEDFLDTINFLRIEGKSPEDINNITESMYLMGLQRYVETGDMDASVSFATGYINKKMNVFDINNKPIRIPKDYDPDIVQIGLENLQDTMIDEALDKGVLYVGVGSEKIQTINTRTQIENGFWRLAADQKGVELVTQNGLRIYSQEDEKPIYIKLDDLITRGDQYIKETNKAKDEEYLQMILKLNNVNNAEQNNNDLFGD